MPVDLSKYLVIAISSRALFDLEEEERIFQRLGLDKYREFQLENENELLDTGTAFPMIRGLLALNRDGQQHVEVIVLSKNHPETGLRVFKSIRHHGLTITRAAFTGGESLNPYLEAFGVDLFLSRSPEDVQEAIDGGFAAAVLYNPPGGAGEDSNQLRIAFDADAVLFSEESEALFREKGLQAFLDHEREKADEPMTEGPVARLLVKLVALQRQFPMSNAPLRIAIVTARNSPAHERVIKTLRSWGVGVDAAFFLGGVAKQPVLKAFGAHIFFDDQEDHLALASMSVAAALVPWSSRSVLRKPRDGASSSVSSEVNAEEVKANLPPAPDSRSAEG
jgi:5'-nucleotidase